MIAVFVSTPCPILPHNNCSVCEHTEYTVAYNSYGVTCTEVEVDVLTGCTEILRVDMLYDCGER